MDPVTLSLAKSYADQLALGGGSLKGAPAVIQSITPVAGGNEVTFSWTLSDGTVQTAAMTVKDGVGVPTGGEPGQVLTKLNEDDYSTYWADQTGGGTGNVSSSEVSAIKVLDRAEYDALSAKDEKTLYFIKG